MTAKTAGWFRRACVNGACTFFCPKQKDCVASNDVRDNCECRNDISQTPPSSIDKTRCGKCGSTSLNDLGHGKKGAVICLCCGASWWERWRSAKDHEDYINVVDGVDTRKRKTPNNMKKITMATQPRAIIAHLQRNIKSTKLFNKEEL